MKRPCICLAVILCVLPALALCEDALPDVRMALLVREALLPVPGATPRDLLLDLEATTGRWERVCGIAGTFNKSLHHGYVTEARVTPAATGSAVSAAPTNMGLKIGSQRHTSRGAKNSTLVGSRTAI